MHQSPGLAEPDLCVGLALSCSPGHVTGAWYILQRAGALGYEGCLPQTGLLPFSPLHPKSAPLFQGSGAMV